MMMVVEEGVIEKIGMTYNRLSDITIGKLSNTLDVYIDPFVISDVKTSFIMMFSETRKCLVNRFLTSNDLKKIYMCQILSIEHFMWAYEMLTYDYYNLASDLYNMFISTLLKVKNYAISIECYEVAANLDRFVDLFIEKTTKWLEA